MTTDTRALVERLRTVLAGRDEILEAYVFGSVARGSAQAHSDLDVAVYLADPRPPSSPFGYAADLAAALMAALGAPSVDVVVLNDASPILYHRVLRDGIRILTCDLRATTTREAGLSRATATGCPSRPRSRPRIADASAPTGSADEPRPARSGARAAPPARAGRGRPAAPAPPRPAAGGPARGPGPPGHRGASGQAGGRGLSSI